MSLSYIFSIFFCPLFVCQSAPLRASKFDADLLGRRCQARDDHLALSSNEIMRNIRYYTTFATAWRIFPGFLADSPERGPQKTQAASCKDSISSDICFGDVQKYQTICSWNSQLGNYGQDGTIFLSRNALSLLRKRIIGVWKTTNRTF